MEYSQSTNLIQGVHHGVTVGQHQRLDEINDRICDRQFPDFPLEANFAPRPTSTKYSLMPIHAQNSNPAPTIPIRNGLEHIVSMNFNPATRNGPWKTYARNIDTETHLQNRNVGLRADSKAMYIPDSNSDMYKVSIVSRPSIQPFEGLFAKPSFDNSIHPNLQGNGASIGKLLFSNSTRTQIKE